MHLLNFAALSTKTPSSTEDSKLQIPDAGDKTLCTYETRDYIYASLNYVLSYFCCTELPTVLMGMIMAIVTIILCTTTVVSVACFIVLFKKKTAGEFI